MKILQCKGYELEKEKSNTSEDFFNRSEVTYEDKGKVKTLYVLYLRYFDEKFHEFVPFTEEPLFQVGGCSVFFKDIVAVSALVKEPKYREQKRIYINSQSEFKALLQGVDFNVIEEIFKTIEGGKSFNFESNLKAMK